MAASGLGGCDQEMAQKFGSGRWVKEGFLDNRTGGRVVGRITFAVIGEVDFLLRGDFSGEIRGHLITFHNPAFEEDELAGHLLEEMESPQTGSVGLMSFDPHPHLPPHPYLEWFSDRENHYRIELAPGAAKIADAVEEGRLETDIRSIADRLA